MRFTFEYRLDQHLGLLFREKTASDAQLRQFVRLEYGCHAIDRQLASRPAS